MKSSRKSTGASAGDKKGLNLRQRLFCLSYIIHKGNGSAAAKAAGYSGDLTNRASDLLANPKIAAVIQAEGAKLVAKAEAKAERVVEELVRIAFADIRRMFRPDNSMIPIPLMDEESASLISGVIVRNGGVRVRFHNKLHALDLLGQYLRLWDGAGNLSKNHLHEVLAAFKAGPIEPESDTDRKDKPHRIQ